MCLSTVTKTYEPNDNMVEVYKLYEHTSTINKFMTPYRIKIHKIGVHYKANNKKIVNSRFEEYDSGFHAYATKKAAIDKSNSIYITRKVVCRCLLWDIRAEGTQANKKVIVGKNIRIMEVIKS